MFSGPVVVTLKVFEDNILVREMLEARGEGRVLVIDGGASLRCALVGGNTIQSHPAQAALDFDVGDARRQPPVDTMWQQ
ncbi:hypothetical protein ACJRO7_000456, partial [Eucalyptus globulus]